MWADLAEIMWVTWSPSGMLFFYREVRTEA